MGIEFRQIRLQADEQGKTNLAVRDLEGVAQPTSASWEEVFECVLMPKEVKGLRILDVGAGASDAVNKLLELGAEAYAIDPRYRSRSDLKGRVKKHNVLKDNKLRRNEALESFMDSIKSSPERYLEASATDLPFPDNFFDIVYSRIAITTYLDVDRDIFSNAVEECIRVTKTGGSIRFFPYMDVEPGWPTEINELRLNNEREVVNRLKNDSRIRDISEADVNSNGLAWKTLIIEKAPENPPKLSQVRIVQLKPDDWKILRDLKLSSLGQEPIAFEDQEEGMARYSARTEDEWRRKLDEEASSTISVFAQGNGSYIGMVSGVIDVRQKKAQVQHMYVDPEYRGQKLGRLLLEDLIQRLRSRGDIEKAELAVLETQQPARQLYRSLGFKETDKHRELRGSETYTEIEMELGL